MKRCHNYKSDLKDDGIFCHNCCEDVSKVPIISNQKQEPEYFVSEVSTYNCILYISLLVY